MSRTPYRSAKLAAAVFGALALAGWPLHASAHETAQEEMRVLPMGSSTVAESTPIGDPDHEGHSGYLIDDMAAEVVDWVDSAQPDIVLLHAGANDVLQATVGPINDDATQERADAFNAAIPDVVAARAGQGEPVYFVDNTKYIQPSDVRDDSEGDYYHLTHSGNAKMAAGWYGALTDTEPTRHEAENPNYTTVHNATQLDTENASNYGKVGELDADDSYLEFTVEAPADDVYRMFVRGGNGTGETCTQTLTVNDR